MKQILLVVDRLENWPLTIPGVEVVAAQQYLGETPCSELKSARVFNLCRSYRYQSVGYYVSLLAEARGHKPVPGIATIQDMKSQTIVRFISDDLDRLIQRSLGQLKSDRFILSVYFGRNLARCHDALAAKLFSLIHAPMIRARFVRNREKWFLQNVDPITASEIPDEHRDFVVQAAQAYFQRRHVRTARRFQPRYDLAILHNSSEAHPPSNERAIKKFIKAAQSLRLGVELIGRDDFSRLGEFDALFIRETTSVNHHTFRFARRAAAQGLVVIDDPDSILRCTNKVFLAELLQRHRIPVPRTMIVHKENSGQVPDQLGLPCILKRPDSSFSQGVVKVENRNELRLRLRELLAASDLVIAQQFLPTDFDWRVGILNREVLFVCRYYMAKGHWQIIDYGKGGAMREGRFDGVPVDEAPRQVVRTALKAARLIGDGLYGVDLKQVGRKVYVIEVNDNPNIEAGCEDAVLKDALYLRVMEYFLRRIEQRKAGGGGTR